MATEIVMPVFVRIGEIEAQWGTITFTDEDGPLTEGLFWRELAPFLRTVADNMETRARDDEGEEPDAAPR